LPRAPAAAPTAAAAPALTAKEWFDLGVELEGSSPEEAQQAYHQALELDPTLADAHVNLGCLYQEAKKPMQAEAHYRAAIEHAPADPIPQFNLAALLDDLGRADEAIRHLHKAKALYGRSSIGR